MENQNNIKSIIEPESFPIQTLTIEKYLEVSPKTFSKDSRKIESLDELEYTLICLFSSSLVLILNTVESNNIL